MDCTFVLYHCILMKCLFYLFKQTFLPDCSIYATFYFATEDAFIVNYLCSSCRALDLTSYFRLINESGCVAAYVCVCKSAHATLQKKIEKAIVYCRLCFILFPTAVDLKV